MRTTPVSQWIGWRAWFKLQGPPGGLGEDLRAASVALETAKPHVAEDQRRLALFFRPGRAPADYAAWLDFGEDAVPEREEHRIE